MSCIVMSCVRCISELELYVSVSIWSRGAPIGLPANTAYRAAQSPYSPAAVSSAAPATPPSGSGSMSSSGGGGSVSGSASASASASCAPGLVAGPSVCNVKWNSWLQFPVQYRDLDHASHFGITVWCVAHGTAVHTDRKDMQQQQQPPQAPLRSDSGDDGADSSTPLSPLPAHRCSCVAKSTFSSQLGVHSRLFAVGGCSLPIFNKRGSASNIEGRIRAAGNSDLQAAVCEGRNRVSVCSLFLLQIACLSLSRTHHVCAAC